MNTRPDISFAVHQCAKFFQDPKLLHEKAVKYIGRYLYKTKDKGIILKPKKNGQLDAYVDSDFAGRWHRYFAELRESDCHAQVTLLLTVDVQSYGAVNYKPKSH